MKKGIIFGIAGCASLAAIIYAITRGSKSDTKSSFSKPMGMEENGIEFPEGIFDDEFEDEDEDVTEITCEEVGRVFVVDPECLYGGRAIIRYDGRSYDVKFPEPEEPITGRLIEGSKVKVSIKYTFYTSYATREIVAVDGIPCAACSVMDTSSEDFGDMNLC